MDPPRAPHGRRLASGLILVLFAAIYWTGGRAAQQQLSPKGIGTDDANIYFRYARNIARGLGCVWNPGGERVEGCTSQLWVAVCAASFIVTPEPEPALFAVSVAIAAGAAWLVARGLARLMDPDAGLGATLAAGASLAAWIASSPGHVIWMTAALMDTPVWTATLVAAWAAAAGWVRDPTRRSRSVAFGVALALLNPARPEGVAAAVGLLAIAAILAAARSGPGAAMRALRLPLLLLAVAAFAIFMSRRAYFGWWLPNTWYAKVDVDPGYRIDQGLRYLAGFVRNAPAASVAVIVACLVPLVIGRLRREAALLAAALLAFAVANALFVGGDHFGCWRILQPYWILAPVPIVNLAGAVRGSWRPWVAGAGLATIAASTWMSSGVLWPRLWDTTSLAPSFFLADHGRAIAINFNGMFTPGERPVVGVVAAGGFPFAYEGESFDILGLNDVEMAHAGGERRGAMHGHGAFHAPTFFKRAPDVLIGLMRVARTTEAAAPQERIPFGSLTSDETLRFDALYAPVAITTATSQAAGWCLPVWARRDWLARNVSRVHLRELPAAPR